MQTDRQWGQALIESIRVPEHKSFKATGIYELLFVMHQSGTGSQFENY
jgi:hypothetical protein